MRLMHLFGRPILIGGRCSLNVLQGSAKCCSSLTPSGSGTEHQTKLVWTELSSRATVRLTGVDAVPFLQGIVVPSSSRNVSRETASRKTEEARRLIRPLRRIAE